MSIKSRKEADSAFMWDLSHIFENREKWNAAYERAGLGISECADLKGTLAQSEDSLLLGLEKIYEVAELVELVYVYASLHKESDNGDAEYQDMEGRAVNLIVRFSSEIAFMNPEILSIGEARLGEIIKSEKFSKYRHIIEDIARMAPHTLDENGEKMLAMLSDAAAAPSDSFGMLESVDMTFPEITDKNGEAVELTHGNFRVYIESSDRELRREAYEKYFGEFRKYINTFAAMYSGAVKFDSYFARVRGFGDACESALFASNVPTDVYDSLTSAVRAGLDSMKKYISLRRRALGLDELQMYDLYCPLANLPNITVTYEEACETVKRACAPLGEEYVTLLERAFSEKWIDVYENRGKTTGAFSCGVYGVHPYVLLNFTGTLDDMFTIAHELGHAMHSYFSDRAQDFANHDYKIMAAEVASTVNEVLLTKYLLKTETDPARRAYVLNHFLEGFRTTVFRQTLFAEFERRAHDMYDEGIPLTAESLNSLYRELNLAYYDGVDICGLHDIEWARIPHFYRAFYVYQYATGFCSAVAIADNIEQGCRVDDYLKFLSLGGSDYPIDELKIAGVDLASQETVTKALSVFDRTIDELEEALGLKK